MLQVYITALMLCCFHGLISTHIFQRVVTASVDSHAEICFRFTILYYLIREIKRVP